MEISQVNKWIAINGLILLQVFLLQGLLLYSHWSLLFFLADFLIFLIPLTMNIFYLFGSLPVRNGIASSK